MPFDSKKLSNYPLDPGVYLMKCKEGTILYIGKANSLRVRLRQYFVPGGDGRWMIPFLQELIEEIDTVVTTTEKEALLLESTLIKKHRPRFNALLKDDKSYAALKINNRHPWPMLSLIRYKGKLKNDALYFGPYTSAYDARQTLDLLQKLFPLRQCSDQELARRTRPCILYGMKRCCAPCVGLVTHDQYESYVEATAKFLRGQSHDVLKSLQQQMLKAAEDLEFERAAEVQGLIKAVEKTLQSQSVEKPANGLTGDALGVFRQGDEVIVSQLIFQSGKLHAYKHHNFTRIAETDEELLESFILQSYQGIENLPYEILLPIELDDRQALEEILSQNGPHKVELLCPQRGEKKGLVEMAYKNAQASFHQQKDANVMRERTLLDLQEKLRLSRYPKRIECIDTSHLSGGEPVAALIAFLEGTPDKQRYRRYKLREATPGDDYGSLKEVLQRRYSNEDMPDLLIVDGGKGHLNIALRILQEMNIVSMDVVGVAKEEGRHDRGITQEQVFLPQVKDPLFFPHHSPMLFLLQRIRDEAHRFAISYQKKRRTKVTIRSELSDITGIGPIKQKALLLYFGSVKALREASDEELKKVKGINATDIFNLRQKFNRQS